MNALLLVGLAVFFGTITGKVFQKIKIPQVVGYILIGLIVGKSCLHLFEEPVIDAMMPIVQFTLGIIGFIIGAELKREVFAKFGWSIYSILIGEGLLTFLFVTLSVALITQNLALGLLLGAVASATDPASTINVLWEYRAKGPLTTTITSIVALDDGLAILLYGFASVFAKVLLTSESFSLLYSIGVPLWEIAQSLLLGIVIGLLVLKVAFRIKERELAMSFALGSIAIACGVSLWLKLDIILSCMALGATVVNLFPRKSEPLFKTVRETSAPLYILFFVVVGSQLDIHIFMQTTLVLIVLAYLLSRSFGKVLGAMLGGLVSKARPEVTAYSGAALFTQGGVAMGLAISISHQMVRLVPGGSGEEIGILIMNVVAATTFVVQVVGPAFVKFAVFRAGENNKDIHKDDVIDSLSVKDVMQTDFIPVLENASLTQVIQTIKKEGTQHSTVVKTAGEHVGSISLGNLKEALYEEELKDLLVAGDVMAGDLWTVFQNQPLREAVKIFEEHYVDYLPVYEQPGSQKVIGVLEYPVLIQILQRRLLAGQIAA
jgi:Kef-type K+ transport system membrane component KefB